MTPETIGRYEIVRELGRGAMGIVYEARDPNIERRVALKIVRTDLISANKEDILRRFKNEAKAAGNLNHPNIVTIYDAGEAEGLLYIAMEFIEGTTLQAMLAQQGRVAPERIVEIMRQVCAGLDFAHARGIVHRDVKPANVMMAAQNLVKITDFGIARVGDGMTMTGQVVGTPNYMSPEQVLGKQLDGRSDLFSVGVMLYEMVTGERPFEGQSITTIMYKIVHEEPIAPRKLDSTIHPGLNAIIERALAKAAETRYQSGLELAAALENYKVLGTGTPGDPDATATYSNLPATATMATAAASTAQVSPATMPAANATVVQPPATATTDAPRKRGFSPMLLGCLGVTALLIVSFTVIAVVSLVRDKATKKNAEGAPSEVVETAKPAAPPGAPQAPGSTPAQAARVIERTPPKAASTTAALKLNSTPPGAQILVDGDETGKATPETVSIPRGEHTIAVKMPGFQEASAKFKVKGGEEFEFSPRLVPLGPGMHVVPRIDIPAVNMRNLEQLKGLSEQQKAEIELWDKWGAQQRAGEPTILVNSRPAGAKISVDGADTGQKTPAVLPEKPGKYRVRLELKGYETVERDIEVNPSRGPAMVNLRLKPVAPATPLPPQ